MFLFSVLLRILVESQTPIKANSLIQPNSRFFNVIFNVYERETHAYHMSNQRIEEFFKNLLIFNYS